MKLIAYTIPCVALFTLSSCQNPADKTADAEVKAAEKVTATASGETYHFLPESTILFTGSKVTGSHSGGFRKFEGHFQIDQGAPTGGSFKIQMESTWADSDKLAEHLKNADFFDVPQYPTSRFEATSFQKGEGDSYQVSGNLTLHGVTKNITFPAMVTSQNETFTISSTFDLNRQDFGISYPGRKDDLIRDEVILKLNLHAAKEKASASSE